MRYLLILLLIVFQTFHGDAQDLSKLTSLNDVVSETSGLIFFDNRVVTHNDSEGMSALYEINPQDGEISRSVTILNAENVDWEDIAQDDDFIYIGDFGNNNGNRTNLRIYKLAKSDFISSGEVNAEVINFSYKDQDDFTSAPNDSNYDAETLIAFGGDLYIFSKNWVDLKSNVYKVPIAPGTYEVDRVDVLDAQGLVTGGTFNALSNKVLLTGYSGLNAFVIELSGFSGGKFSNGSMNKYNLSIPLTESFQVEGIAYRDGTNYYLSAEKNTLGNASLYSLTSNTLGVEDVRLVQVQLYPNPGRESLMIDGTTDLTKIEIYDYLGKKVFEASEMNNEVDISQLPSGVYVVKLYGNNGSDSRKIIKQ